MNLGRFGTQDVNRSGRKTLTYKYTLISVKLPAQYGSISYFELMQLHVPKCTTDIHWALTHLNLTETKKLHLEV